MKKIFFSIILISLTIAGFAQSENTFVKDIEKAVKIDKFQKQEAISFDIDLIFGGKSSLKGTVISATNSAWVKLIKEDGTIVLFDGDKVWLKSEAKNNSRARFDVLTWQYFMMATYKLSDPGTIWENLGTLNYDANTKLPASKLTFKSGTGDASDDYYVVYKNQENLIKAMGYIVTFGGKSVANTEKSAHAIVYDDYQSVKGVNIAHQWYFHNWNIKTGIADQIGEAKITNITFLKANEVDHQKPEGAVEVKL